MNAVTDRIHVENVVLDAVAFLNNIQIQNIAKQAFTTENVLKEIKDAATRQRLQTLAYSLSQREPSATSLALVRNFAKKTGDLQCFSAADLSVIALTVDLEKEVRGSLDHLKTEPTFTVAEKEAALSRQGNRAVTDTAPSKMDVEASELQHESVSDDDNEEDWETDDEEGSDGEEDDMGNWITPDNFQAMAAKIRQSGGVGLDVFGGRGVMEEMPVDKVAVGCMTTDFAMQNVLTQMGLVVLTVDGKRISRPRSYVLWCSSCYHSMTKFGIFFCPKCGHDSLRRIPVSMDESGKLIYHFKKNFTYNLKNTIFAVPAPQGGKHACNPIRFEHQPVPQQKARKVKNAMVQELDPRLDWDEQNPFATHNHETRAALHGFTETREHKIRSFDGKHLKPTRGPLKGGRNHRKKG